MKNIDHAALNTLAMHWVLELNCQTDDVGSAGQAVAANLLPNDTPWPLGCAFGDGVNFGIRVAAAVLLDPFSGEVLEKIAAATKDSEVLMRRMNRDMKQEYVHRSELESKGSARRIRRAA